TMQWFCWHVPAKMSLGFLCLFLVCNTGKDNGLSCLVAQQGKLFLSLILHFTASCIRRENKKEKQVAVLATAELPAKSMDLAAINLTELVNGMLNTALRGTKKLFSLLSVTSYSSFAFHKVSVTIYNISNVKNVDRGKFPMHYCYCLNNVTNDLTDFTALLVDIIGNSTSYLTEIFKSTSILSVRQSNDSDCIYICVMAGQTGRNLSEFWEMLEKSPVINYTFSSNTSSDLDLDSIFSSFMKLQEDPNKTVDPSAEHVWTFKSEQILYYCPSECCARCCRGAPAPTVRCWCPPSVSPASPATRIPLAQKGEEIPTITFPPWPKTVEAKGSGFPSAHVDASRPQGTAGPPPTAAGSSAPSAALQPSPSDFSLNMMKKSPEKLKTTASVLPYFFSISPIFTLPSFLFSIAERDSELYFFLGCPQAILKESRVTSPPVTLIVQKINPCVMELCRFFQLCLCVGQRRYSRKEAMRYCVEYYSWFLKNANYVCERVKRVAYSHTLKQKCLKNICTSV
ncbi:HERV-H LTR-associating protein 1, partial [Eudyptes filholi]